MVLIVVLVRIIKDIFDVVDKLIRDGTLIRDLKISALHALSNKWKISKNIKIKVVLLFQDMLEVVSRDIMVEQFSSHLESSHGVSYGRSENMKPSDKQIQLFASLGAIRFPLPDSVDWTEKLKRLILLLTEKESAMDVPANLEARRRISFFTNSLFMNMPSAPKIRNMLSFSVLTPYYNEDVLFSLPHLEEENEDGVSILFYLQKIYPGGASTLGIIQRTNSNSHRSFCTYFASAYGPVRGMMYCRKALELQSFLDMAKDEDLMKGYKDLGLSSEEQSSGRSLSAQCQAVADMKFTYVVSCQIYGDQKRSGQQQAQDILRLMTKYPSLRVAYIDEVEMPKEDRKVDKIYYSTLVIYRIKLPGYAILGEGKPENQNHAIIFTRGEGLQTIDMNQDNYLEEALKMRNLLQEFLEKHDGVRYPSILGVREHIFTGSVSSLAWFMSNQETSFVTIAQRLLANPLRVRFHYGHPDVFDRLFHLARGGVRFNSTLREGSVTHHEYLQLTVLTVYVFLYGRLYLALSGLEEGLATSRRFAHNEPLQVALASQSFVQLGFLMALPMMMEIGLEKGFRKALSEFIMMQLQLASVFFTFSLGTKTHYYGRTLLHGGAEYRGTGRGFVVFHAKFAENYRLYSRSHFVKAIELMILLIIYQIFGQSYRSPVAYIFITASMWFMVGTWLFAPFLFNPSGFEWQKIVDDWTDWNKWISNRGGIGVHAEKSWESWWEKEQEHLKYSGKRGTITEILLALRFFIYQYGLVYHLNITKDRSILVYGISWLVIVAILLVMKTVSVGRRRFSANFQLVFRLIKFLIFVTFVSILIILIVFAKMTFQDTIVCLLAFLPTGWGLLLIAQACKPALRNFGVWGSVRALARGYEMTIGLLLFSPIAFLAWFPFVSEFQTRMLFNQAFSRGLQISHSWWPQEGSSTQQQGLNLV
ncbi:hypothetical protein HPP92_008271 [Vanilla planifolia]|uniref:1,3-beta-glucan synthase n=1 Tax=Vanilla planifolia TaxID=51239 RepID=A0A835V7R5_VANPL|nr:hypothetical protein HPP92_008271 [Vanilla planifolia]